MLVLMTAAKLAQPGVDLIRAAGHELRFLTSDRPGEEMSAILAAEPVAAVISRTLPVTAVQIASCPTLRVISRHGVGYDNVDLEAASARGIPVTVVDAGNAQSVAEMALALMLAVARAVPALDGSVRGGAWDRSRVGLQLSGRRLGLVGYGTIARKTADMARAIGMSVAAFDPYARNLMAGQAGADVLWCDDLAALLGGSDVLSLHVPLTPATRGMIGAAELALLPNGGLIINTARGGLIDEAALAHAVTTGHLAGAGIDTFADEPLSPGHPFLSLPQIILTPHMGGSTDAALDGVAISAARNVLDILAGRGVAPRLVVNAANLGPSPSGQTAQTA